MALTFKVGIVLSILILSTNAQSNIYEDCFTGASSEKVKEIHKVGMALGDRISIYANNICQFQTFGSVELDYYSTDIIVGYYTYSGSG